MSLRQDPADPGHRENVYHAPEDVEINLDISLKNLGLEYGMRHASSGTPCLRAWRIFADTI